MTQCFRYCVALFFLSAALLTSCAPQPSAAPSDPLRGRPTAPKVGEKAYNFALNDLQGNPVLLSDFRGKRVMVNFWATWCGPCRSEIADMVKLYDELHDQGFEILAVNVGEGATRVKDFAERFDMRFPVLLDSRQKVAVAYRVEGIPTSVFVDQQGIIRAIRVGPMTLSTMRGYIDELTR